MNQKDSSQTQGNILKTTGLDLCKKSIFFLCIITSVSSAMAQDHEKRESTLSSDCIKVHTTYQTMSIEELQKEVEKHSNKGTLSFALGQELIKRWTKS